MTAWPAKDPDSIADFSYTIPLDEVDTVASYDLTRLSGTVAIDSDSIDGAKVTAWLSGGVDGETAVFRIAWTTAGGRSFDDAIALPVAQGSDALVLALMARYPAFAAVSTGTVAYWIKDAGRIVTDGWGEDYEPGTLALAAHNMTLAGVAGIAKGAGASLPAGVTRFRSGSMDIGISETAANRLASGGYAATIYGVEFAVMLRRNAGLPMLVGFVDRCVPC